MLFFDEILFIIYFYFGINEWIWLEMNLFGFFIGKVLILKCKLLLIIFFVWGEWVVGEVIFFLSVIYVGWLLIFIFMGLKLLFNF